MAPEVALGVALLLLSWLRAVCDSKTAPAQCREINSAPEKVWKAKINSGQHRRNLADGFLSRQRPEGFICALC